MKKIYLLLFLSIQLSYGQNNPYDSLERKLAAEKNDVQKLEILNKLIDMAYAMDMNKSLEYAKLCVALSEKTGYKNRKPQLYQI